MIELPHADWELLLRLMISFMSGALMGLEREKYKIVRYGLEESEQAAPGVRSFGFISLMGAFTVVLPMVSNNGAISFPMSISFMFLSVAIIGAYTIYRFMVLKEGGITTSIALGIAYAVGIMAGMGLLLEAIAIAIFSAFALAVKLRIEKVIRGMTYHELISALEIGVLVFLIGPFIPEGYDPLFHIVNFRMLYLFFVIILIISYLGYISLKTIGLNFIEYFSMLGGLVHSEATTVSIVSLYRKGVISRNLMMGSLIATITAMIVRNCALVLALTSLSTRGIVLEEDIAYALLGLIPSAVIGYVLFKFLLVKNGERPEKLSLESPFSFKVAFKALVTFTAILVITAMATRVFGVAGVLGSSILGGLVSAEAVIFTVFSLASAESASLELAIVCSLCATLSSVLNKVLFAKAMGADNRFIKDMWWRILLIIIPLILASIMLMS